MEYSKLDARLNEALVDPSGEPARFEVFIDLDRQPAAADLQQLEAFGILPADRPGAILTAEVTRETLSAISDLRAVRHVTLKRRLKKA
jgi:hypothetical protein